MPSASASASALAGRTVRLRCPAVEVENGASVLEQVLARSAGEVRRSRRGGPATAREHRALTGEHRVLAREHHPPYDDGGRGHDQGVGHAPAVPPAAAVEHVLRGDEAPFEPDRDPSRLAPPPDDPDRSPLLLAAVAGPPGEVGVGTDAGDGSAGAFARRAALARTSHPTALAPERRDTVTVARGAPRTLDRSELRREGYAAYTGPSAPGISPDEVSPDASEPGNVGSPPFGLPVLAEVPLLAGMLEDLRRIDRLVASCVSTLAVLDEHDVAPTLTGVGLSTWMSLVARRTGADIRMLRSAVEMCGRLPTLRSAFAQGELSWSQVRSIVLTTKRLPRHLDDQVDGLLAARIAAAAGAEPDHVCLGLRRAVADLEPSEVESNERVADRAQFVNLQPALDGSGGDIYGKLGPRLFAAADALLSRGLPSLPPSRRGFVGDPVRDGDGDGDADGDGGRRARRQAMLAAGAARAANLQRLFDDVLLGEAPVDGDHDLTSGWAADGTATARDPADGRAAGSTRRRRGRPPQVLVRADLATLLRRDQVPADLLTTLVGGHLRLSAEATRRLLDERGADLRMVTLDETGQVVGVGRRTRVPPNWLRDAALALHDTCSAPGCQTAATVCELDHARPWHPHRPGDLPGRTDIDQLAPLCARDNASKERDGWTASQRADGSRRWTHRRSGLTTRTLPARWRPPPPGPEPPDGPSNPAERDPPPRPDG